MRRALIKAGFDVVRLTEDDRRNALTSYDPDTPLPDDAFEVLSVRNPRLRALRKEYRALDLPVCRHTVWDEERRSRDLTLPWFRGDNAYIWQFRHVRSELRLKQYLTLKYVETRDDLGLLSRLKEDGAFGCWTFQYGDRAPISRDLLDSVNEINYLNQQLGIADIVGLKVLDIGAGYGRLAHRMCLALPNLERYDCVDAVPESTFLCDYYLRYRGVEDRASSIPLHKLHRLASPGKYHVAVNIHCFSECTLDAVRWWLAKLRELRIRYLLIVPNEPEKMLTSEVDGTKEDFSGAVSDAGYKLLHKAPVFDNDEVLDLIGVRDHFFLYELSPS